MDKVNSQIFDAIDEQQTIRIVVVVPTDTLCGEDFITSASNLIFWKHSESCKMDRCGFNSTDVSEMSEISCYQNRALGHASEIITNNDKTNLSVQVTR